MRNGLIDYNRMAEESNEENKSSREHNGDYKKMI